MDNISTSNIQNNSGIYGTSSPHAFIFYRPQTKGAKEELFYNEEAWRVISLSVPTKKRGTISPHDISSLCSKWKELVDKRIDEHKEDSEKRHTEASFIDIIQSKRRRYAVRGIALSGEQPSTHTQEKQFLFILERICPDNLNLSMIFRQGNFSRREQEVVILLLADKSNKEIASELGLSVNTVKGYLKLLMRRLGVNSRAGIVARLFTEK